MEGSLQLPPHDGCFFAKCQTCINVPLPGWENIDQNEDFSVAGYMKKLSKPYSKLDLSVCKTHEYTQHIAEAEGNEDMAIESSIEVMDCTRVVYATF